MSETALVGKKVQITVIQKIYDVIDAATIEIAGKNLAELTVATNRQIELGVETAEAAKMAENIRKDGALVLRASEAIRLEFTSPAETYKKMMITKVRDLMQQLTDANTKLFAMLKAKEQKRRDDEAAAQAELDRKRREAAEAAHKREEWNRNISLGKHGTGEVRHVEPEKVEQPITIPQRKVTNAKSLPDKDKIQAAIDEGVYEIPGVEIKRVWVFQILESKLVPEKYRSLK